MTALRGEIPGGETGGGRQEFGVLAAGVDGTYGKAGDAAKRCCSPGTGVCIVVRMNLEIGDSD